MIIFPRRLDALKILVSLRFRSFPRGSKSYASKLIVQRVHDIQSFEMEVHNVYTDDSSELYSRCSESEAYSSSNTKNII